MVRTDLPTRRRRTDTAQHPEARAWEAISHGVDKVRILVDK